MTLDEVKKSGIAAALAIAETIEGNAMLTVELDEVKATDSENVASATLKITMEEHHA